MTDDKYTREVTWAEMDDRWPGASVYFERDCRHMHDQPGLSFWVVKNKLQARTTSGTTWNERGGASPRSRAYWHPEMKVWARVKLAMPVVPYRDYDHDIVEVRGLAYTRLQRRFSEIPELHTAMEPLKRVFEEVLADAVTRGILEPVPVTTPPVVPGD